MNFGLKNEHFYTFPKISSSANDVVESVNVVNTIILTITIFTIHKLMILLTITVLF